MGAPAAYPAITNRTSTDVLEAYPVEAFGSSDAGAVLTGYCGNPYQAGPGGMQPATTYPSPGRGGDHTDSSPAKNNTRIDEWVSTLVSQTDASVLQTAISTEAEPTCEELDWWGATVSFLGSIFQPPKPEGEEPGEVDIHSPEAALHAQDGGTSGCANISSTFDQTPGRTQVDSTPDASPSTAQNSVSAKSKLLQVVSRHKEVSTGDDDGVPKPSVARTRSADPTLTIDRPDESGTSDAQNTAAPHKSRLMKAVTFAGVRSRRAQTCGGEVEEVRPVENKQMARRNTLAASFRKQGSAGSRSARYEQRSLGEEIRRKTDLMNLASIDMEAELTSARPVPRLSDGSLDMRELSRESVWGRASSLQRLKSTLT